MKNSENEIIHQLALGFFLSEQQVFYVKYKHNFFKLKLQFYIFATSVVKKVNIDVKMVSIVLESIKFQKKNYFKQTFLNK